MFFKVNKIVLNSDKYLKNISRGIGIQISKLGTPSPAKIGDIITYMINVTIPVGVTAYNLTVTDNYPLGSQLYIGNMTRNGFPIEPVSLSSSGTITFPTESKPIIPLGADIDIIYSFDVKVTSGLNISPYYEYQLNTATVNWNTTETGTPAAPINSSFNLAVISPKVRGIINQKNVSKGNSPLTESLLYYTPNDVIQYVISLTNEGLAPAYNLSLIDILNSFLSIITGSISVTNGTYSYEISRLNWTIPFLAANETVTISFKADTLKGIGANTVIDNKAEFIYSSSSNNLGINYGPIDSNTVQLKAPSITIKKTSDITTCKIGDIVQYTIKVTIPFGTIGYDVFIEDILSTGETYIKDSATLQITPPGSPAIQITPDLISHAPAICFTAPTNYDASFSSILINISFNALIVSANHTPPYKDKQTNTAIVKWKTSSKSQVEEYTIAKWDIVVCTPNITVLKQQNLNSGDTTDTITNVFPGDTISYKFTITNNGTAPAYNIIIRDYTTSFLTYNGNWMGPYLLYPCNQLSDAGSTMPPPAGTHFGGIAIPALYNGDTAVFQIEFTLEPVPGLNVIYNNASFDYKTSNSSQYSTSYSGNSNTVNILCAGLNLTKSVSKNTAIVGDIITYTVVISIPSEIYAYNLTLEDVIPSSQQYITGSAARNAGSGPVSIAPHMSGNSIIFTDPEDYILGHKTILYTFNSQILTGSTNPPYTEIQTNSAIIKWKPYSYGTFTSSSTATCSLNILNAHLISTKKQRLLPSGTFTTEPLIGIKAGDEIEYEISMTNNGAPSSWVHPLITTDVISPYLIFLHNPADTKVSNTVPDGSPGGIITIDFSNISFTTGPTISKTLKFKISDIPIPPAITINEASTSYKASLYTLPLTPAKTNKLSLTYAIPSFEKSCNKSAVISGSTVTYTIRITISSGLTAYRLLAFDCLKSGQIYADNYTEFPPFSGANPDVYPPYIYFPHLGYSVTNATIILTYDAKLIAQTDNVQEVQTNEATLSWFVDEYTRGPDETSSSNVYVTKINLLLENSQKNLSAKPSKSAYYTEPVNANVGDYMEYKLKITNNTQLSDFHNPPPISDLSAKNITLTDILDNHLQYLGIAVPPDKGCLYHDNSSSGGTIKWVLDSLELGETSEVIILVKVLPGMPQGSYIENFTNASYSVDNTPDVLYNSLKSNTVLLTFNNITLTKTCSVTTAKISEVVTYTVTVNIPKGTKLYNFKFTDTLPDGESFYGTTGNLIITPPGSSQAVAAAITAQTVEFPSIGNIDTSAADTSYAYSFQVKITSGKTSGDYIDIQTNSAEIVWDTAPSGGTTKKQTSECTITVPSPKLVLSKTQRNATTGTAYDINPIVINSGDILEYKFIVSNIGAAPVYNAIITDVLDNEYNFERTVYTPPAPPSNSFYYSPNTVTWELEYINPNETFESVFSIRDKSNAAAGDNKTNNCNGAGDTNNLLPPSDNIKIPTLNSNSVKHLYKKIAINKSTDYSDLYLGNTVHYKIQFILAAHTLAYKVILTDVLPIGQNYVNNSGIFTDPNTGSIQLNPTISSQLLTILNEINIGPYSVDTTFTYTFDAIINTAILYNTANYDTQTNNAVIQWKFDSNGTEPADSLIATDNTSVSIAVHSQLDIQLYQRNTNNSNEFTQNTIEAINGDTIEFRVAITNTSSSDIHNLNISDLLSNYLRYKTNTYISPLGTITHSGQYSDGTVNMELHVLPGYSSAEFKFTVEVSKLPLTAIKNIVLATFNPISVNTAATGYLYSNSISIKTNLVAECIIVNKIFSQFSSKKCFSNIKVYGTGSLNGIQFYKGTILDNSIKLEPIPGSKKLYNVRYLVSIKYKAEMYDKSIYYVEDWLPLIEIQGIMYVPKIEPTSEPIFTVDTFTKILNLNNVNNTFTVGIYLVNSISYKIQLFIPSVDYFSFPNNCIHYIGTHIPSILFNKL